MDAFFAAVEVLDRPELRGRPLIVGAAPDKRGVVATCSYEARRFGVHSAMPSRTAFKLCPQAVFVAPRHNRYAEISRQVMTLLETFSPEIEPVSIDEAFCDITGVLHRWPDARTLAVELKQRIRSGTGLTASVGIAPNKFLAKLASDLEKPDGLTMTPFDPDGIAAFLRPLPVERLWGVGKVTAAALHGAELTMVGDIQARSTAELERLLGPALAAHVHALAHGRDERPVNATPAPEKSISGETTFDTRLCRSDPHPPSPTGNRRGGRPPPARRGPSGGTVHLKVRFGRLHHPHPAGAADPAHGLRRRPHPRHPRLAGAPARHPSPAPGRHGRQRAPRPPVTPHPPPGTVPTAALPGTRRAAPRELRHRRHA